MGTICGLASDHYQCLHFYIPATQHFCFSETWWLYPIYSQVPIASQHDLSIATATNFLQAFGTTVLGAALENFLLVT